MKGLSDKDKETLQAVGIAVAKGTVGMIPGASIAAELLGVVIPDKQNQRFHTMYTQFSERVAHLEAELLHQRMRETQFVDLFEICCHETVRTQMQSKLKALGNILASSVNTDSQNSYLKKEVLILSSLDDLDLIILLRLHELRKAEALTLPRPEGRPLRDIIRFHVYEANDADLFRAAAAWCGHPEFIADPKLLREDYRYHTLSTAYEQSMLKLINSMLVYISEDEKTTKGNIYSSRNTDEMKVNVRTYRLTEYSMMLVGYFDEEKYE